MQRFAKCNGLDAEIDLSFPNPLRGAASHAGSHASHAYAALQLPSRQLQFGDLSSGSPKGGGSILLIPAANRNHIESHAQCDISFHYCVNKVAFISTLLHVHSEI